MAFKKIGKEKEDAQFKRVGTIWESDKYKGLYLRIDEDCDLVLYDRKTGKYYKVNKVAINTPSESAPKGAVLNLYVNLDNKSQVEYQGSDAD